MLFIVYFFLSALIPTSTLNQYTVYSHDDCFTYGIKYVGNNLHTDGKYCTDVTETAKKCHLLCQKTAECIEFTWLETPYDGVAKRCCLKNKKNTDVVSQLGAVSGPKECGKF